MLERARHPTGDRRARWLVPAARERAEYPRAPPKCVLVWPQAERRHSAPTRGGEAPMSSKSIDASPPRRSSPTPVGRVRPSLFLPEKRKADGANLAETPSRVVANPNPNSRFGVPRRTPMRSPKPRAQLPSSAAAALSTASASCTLARSAPLSSMSRSTSPWSISRSMPVILPADSWSLLRAPRPPAMSG